MNPILAFLTNRWLLAALLSIAVMYGVQQHTIASLAEDRANTAELSLATSRRDLTTCQTNQTNILGGLEAQNRAVSSLGEKMKGVEAKSAEAAQAARKSAKAAANQAAAIMAYRPKTGDLCAEAFKLGVE